MSWWQRWQACDCMKYFAGIFLPSRVCTELGKNFPLGPSPSPSMVSVVNFGLATRLAFFQPFSPVHQKPTGIPETSKEKIAKLQPDPTNPVPTQDRRASNQVPGR